MASRGEETEDQASTQSRWCMADIGIDDSFIKRVRDSITPGTSAVFLMTTDAVKDRVIEALRGFDAELIQTNLSQEEEAKLREVFAEEA